jgi:hypothetical protein
MDLVRDYASAGQSGHYGPFLGVREVRQDGHSGPDGHTPLGVSGRPTVRLRIVDPCSDASRRAKRTPKAP